MGVGAVEPGDARARAGCCARKGTSVGAGGGGRVMVERPSRRPPSLCRVGLV